MKAVICGAGIAGLALAHRMATLGADTIVLERAPGPRNQGYMIDFFGAGYDAAEAMGVLPAVERYEQLMRPIVVEKQKLARHSARWFLPETALQLRIRRIAMRLGRLPGIDRYVAGVVAGKSTALITNLRRESDSPVLTGAEPGAHR